MNTIENNFIHLQIIYASDDIEIKDVFVILII